MSSGSEEDMNCTPPELREKAGKAEESLLPEKSRERYEKSFKMYENWCTEKKVKNIASETVLLAFFSDMSRDKKPSTLWSAYSMIKTMLALKERVDISKFGKLLAFLKRQNVGYRPTKSNTFSRKNIEDFLLNAPQEFLPAKVALVVGVSGACRSDELMKMRMTDINLLEEKISIEIPQTKTYTSRSFLITDPSWVKIVKEFLNLRENIENDRFFVQWRFGKATKQPFGHNSISQFPKKIATFLKLPQPERFTGHSFRRTAATLLANSGADVLQLKRLGGWKSSAVAEGYVDSSLDNQSKTAKMLSTPSTSHAGPNILTAVNTNGITSGKKQEITFSTTDTLQQSGISISIKAYNKSNLTINFQK